MVSDAILGAIVGGVLTAFGSLLAYYYREVKTRKNLLGALLIEIQHNNLVVKRELDGKLPRWLKHAYGTLSYTSAKDKGAISDLPRDLREKVLDVYDIIFALHHDPSISKHERADIILPELSKRLDDLSRALQKHLGNTAIQLGVIYLCV